MDKRSPEQDSASREPEPAERMDPEEMADFEENVVQGDDRPVRGETRTPEVRSAD